jgi:DNA polymerase
MLCRVADFASWRTAARGFLLRNTPPSELVWQSATDGQESLFVSEAASPPAEGTLSLPRGFLELASEAAMHSNPARWAVLYRVAWRILNENRHLLQIETDDDIRALVLMRKAVHTDIHKMRAFVRFRRVTDSEGEQYVAWYRPDHHTLAANERFFVDRFKGMRWAILTPDASLIWDLKKLHHGPGVPRSEAPAEDAFEDLWRTYYSSIYNPARLNIDAMRAQMPMRRWKDLPESQTISELVRNSPGRVNRMAQTQPDSASRFIPPNATLPVLREAIKKCGACELCETGALNPVFGEGPETARVLIVGEQPGDEEDRAGRPFVGPAGQVLDVAMRAAGLDRPIVYVTNAVKVFRFEERGKRRIHQTPRPAHIATCRPWLEAEVSQIRPAVIVCLGATAAQSVLGRIAHIGEERTRAPEMRYGAPVIVTYHPSAILRARDDSARAEMQAALQEDLMKAASIATM